MTIEKVPFVNYTLDENRIDNGVEVITLKLNKNERELIERLKRMTNYNQDAKIIKAGLICLEKSILSHFGEDLFKKFTDPNRRRPIFDTIKEPATTNQNP